jgi:apolipoprotein N-acyltransferase
MFMLHWLAQHLPPPLRWLARLFAPDSERGFGFWWLVVTLGIAVVLGTVVALLLTPVAGLIALLVVAIWALFRRHGSKRDERDNFTVSAPARGTERPSGTLRRTAAEAPGAAAA